MSNVGRVLTLRVTITDHEASKWIWDAYPNPINGVKVTALSDGDMFAEHEQLENGACYYIREEGEDTQDAIQAHAEPFYTIQDAAREAPGNTSKGSKWDIIDARGNVVKSGGPEA